MSDSFSRRHTFAGKAAEITIRQDAPADLRFALLQTPIDLGFGAKASRPVVCRVLRRVSLERHHFCRGEPRFSSRKLRQARWRILRNGAQTSDPHWH
jgi:hypothetical protein